MNRKISWCLEACGVGTLLAAMVLQLAQRPPLRHTQSVTITPLLIDTKVTSSISPEARLFRHFSRTLTPNPAYASPTTTYLTRSFTMASPSHHRAVGSQTGLTCAGVLCARHETTSDLFRQLVVTGGIPRNYAITPHEYHEQELCKRVPSVRTVLAPPRGIRIKVHQPFGQTFRQKHTLLGADLLA